MAKIVLMIGLLVAMNHEPVQAQFLKKLIEFFTGGSKAYKLNETDAANGIKEALSNGISNGVQKTSSSDGFFKNIEIKIPFPPDAQEVETKLRGLGFGNKIDEVVLTLNRAAEDASKEAKPIFVDAIKALTISEAINIVRGSENAATEYLKRMTYTKLKSLFQPKIESSLTKVNATKYWKDIMDIYNKIPFVKKINPDLTDYVCTKALDGLFIMVAKEEKQIRIDPVARTTELLRKVFGKNN